ncbi:MFS transporter [Gordonia sp. w5E2]|uniref:Major facilitator superfamily (MFS) profile domain-containing protein n=1 Tax=Gordonia jacobaea TaxID=122202 RepID=A0ABR5IGR9_9ACTN|nr:MULTISPECIES: MFS transporter [Gordonia]KNA92827.1 hypothetical protein ABW18_03715 [Gordonia jacobaea]
MNDQRKARRAAIGAFAGTTIEYYDFVIYGTAAAAVFGSVFFPEGNDLAATAAALATFAVAFVARPIGGMIFGALGDRAGRKTTLVATVSIMGVSTFLIGCLPGYAVIGATAPVLLVVLRFLQGIALGGEWGSATLMAVEHAPAHRRGLYGTFVQLGSPAGSMIASLLFFALSATNAGLQELWRIPFLFAGVLTVVALVIRLRVGETPEFTKVRDAGEVSKQPLVAIFREGRVREVGLATGALLLGFGGFQITSVFLVLVYARQVGFSQPQTLLASVILSAASVCTFSLYGKLGDRFGILSISIVGCLYTIVMAFPMFAMVHSGNLALYLLAVPICYAGANAVFALNSSLAASRFPREIRATGISVSSTLAALLGGAFAPLISTQLLRATGGSYWPIVLFLIAQATISLACMTVMLMQARRVGETKTPASVQAVAA